MIIKSLLTKKHGWRQVIRGKMFSVVHQAAGMEIRENIYDVAREIYANSFEGWSKYKSLEKDSIKWPVDVNGSMEISYKIIQKKNRSKGYCLGTWILDN